MKKGPVPPPQRPLRRELAREELRWASLAALGLACFLGLTRTGVWLELEELAEASLLRGQLPTPWNPEVAVVLLDDATFDRYGRPLPRRELARLVEFLDHAGARVVGFDLLFTSPGVDGQQGEERFARAMEASGKVVLGTACSGGGYEPDGPLGPWLWPKGATPAAPCSQIILPHRSVLRGPAALGQMHTITSGAGILRGVYPLAQTAEGRMPGLALAMLQVADGGVRQLQDRVELGKIGIRLDREAQVITSVRGLPHFSASGSGEGPTFSASALLQAATDDLLPSRLPEAVGARFFGRYVLIGAESDLYADTGRLANGVRAPQVAIHAAALSDALENRRWRDAGAGLVLWVTFALALLLFAAGRLLSTSRFMAACVTLALVAPALTVWLYGLGLYFGPLAPLLGALLGGVFGRTRQHLLGQRERRSLEAAFGAYVSPQVLRRIIEDPEKNLALGGARRDVTVMFCDIQGYTALTTGLEPEEVFELLRRCMGLLIGQITAAGGRVDKMMGDGLMAVFGDPSADPDHARTAVETALRIQEAADRGETDSVQTPEKRLRIRIGIATGECFLGNVGLTDSKIEYTALGRTVNLASRLEGKAPPGGVLVSAETWRRCGDAFAFEALAPFELKGLDGPQEAWVVHRQEVDRERSL